MDEVVFKAKTVAAYTLKTLSEVLQNILTDVCFEFCENGIRLVTMDNKDPPHLMINLELKRDRFEEYICTKQEYVGVNLQHFYKLLKSIKKKDKLILFINKHHRGQLGICTETEAGQHSFSYIKIQKLRRIEIEPPDTYNNHPHLILTSGFQKLCKDMTGISKNVKIYTKGNYISFSSEFEGMFTRMVPFGILNTESDEEEYEDVFYTKSLTQLIKISGLHSKMQIYTKQMYPLRFSVYVGDLGTLDIYIKSKSQLKLAQEY